MWPATQQVYQGLVSRSREGGGGESSVFEPLVIFELLMEGGLSYFITNNPSFEVMEQMATHLNFVRIKP